MSKNEPGSLSSHSLQIQKGRSRRLFSSEFDLIVKPNADSVKITVAVSKKIAIRAVDRNRIKRIIKEAIRKSGTLDASLTFKVKKNLASLKSYQVEQLIKKILSI